MNEQVALADAPRVGTRSTLAERLRRAALSVAAGAVALLGSVVALSLFFAGVGAVFGPINDVLLALAFGLFIPAMLVSRSLAAARGVAWLDRLALLGIAGIAVLIAGNALLVVGVLPLVGSFATVTIGFLALLTWGGGLSVFAWRGQGLSRALGGWFVAFAVAFVAAALGWAVLPIAVWSVLGLALFVAFIGWLAVLARDLAREADRVERA